MITELRLGVPYEWPGDGGYLEHAQRTIAAAVIPALQSGLKRREREVLATLDALGGRTASLPEETLARHTVDVRHEERRDRYERAVEGMLGWRQPPLIAAGDEVVITPVGEVVVEGLRRGRTTFPQLLVNGAEGVAVGIEVAFPPHPLGEVLDAIALVAEDREVPLHRILDVCPGPDPGEGRLRRAGIAEAYARGEGTLRHEVDGVLQNLPLSFVVLDEQERPLRLDLRSLLLHAAEVDVEGLRRHARARVAPID